MKTIVVDPKVLRIVGPDEVVKSASTAAPEGSNPAEETKDDEEESDLPEAQLLPMLVRYFKSWKSGEGEGFTARKEGETVDDFVKRLTEQLGKDHPDVVASVGGDDEFKAWVAVACKYDGGGGDEVTIPEWEMPELEEEYKDKSEGEEEAMKGVWKDMAEKSVRIPEITMKAEEAAELIEIELERYVCEWHSGNVPYFCGSCVPISMDGLETKGPKLSAEEFACKCADELISRVTYRDDMLLAMRSKGGVKKFRKWLHDTILSLANEIEKPVGGETKGNGGEQPDVADKK